MDRFQLSFPHVDLRFQLIAGSVRGPVDNVDLGMRFIDPASGAERGVALMKEVMLPVCSPPYRRAEGDGEEGNTLIQLTDSPSDWVNAYPLFDTGREGAPKSRVFSDYAVVVQAALLGQGIAFGWITVVSHALLTGTLVPAASHVTRGPRIAALTSPGNRLMRPVVREIRDWIIAELRADIEAIDRLYPGLGLLDASY